tara:strand:+ start:958 stop:1131 length:174 start_codon:yes stop_codon:yes gene_type:complete
MNNDKYVIVSGDTKQSFELMRDLVKVAKVEDNAGNGFYCYIDRIWSNGKTEKISFVY